MDIMKDGSNSSLWIVDLDGSNHEKLTALEGSEYGAAWSPTGDRIAFVSGTENGSEIFIYWTGSMRLAKISNLPGSPSGLHWSPDGNNIAFSMFVPEKPVVMVRPPAKPAGAEWADVPRVTTRVKHEADGSGYMKPGFRHVFVIPADGGTARQISDGNYHHSSDMDWSKDSKKVFVRANRSDNWEYEYRNSEIYAIDVEDGSVQQLTDREGPDMNPVVSPDGTRIAYLGYDDKVQTYQITNLYIMNVDGSGKQQVDIRLDRSISNIQWSAKGDGLYYQYDDKGNGKIGFSPLSGGNQKIVDNVGGTVLGRPYGGGDFSVSSKNEIVFTYGTPMAPADLVGLTKGGKSTKRLTDLNSDILGRRTLGQVEEIWYKSSVDGRDIQGWIVKPPFYEEGKKYPLLVENHGGPIANYGDRFSAEMQLFAAGGYVVFYPNPRGSTSYGEEFGNLLYHDYPGDDYHDVMDGVDAVIKTGMIADGELYVTGGSAGGLMTAWIVGNNDRFKAAAVVKPVMNWISKTLVADNYFGYYDSRLPGLPWEETETYWEYSPISKVGNIKTPTMVMVGMADLRTPPSEAKQLYHALKVRKIETALVEIPGSYHNISRRPSQLITKVDHILAWFAKYRD